MYQTLDEIEKDHHAERQIQYLLTIEKPAERNAMATKMNNGIAGQGITVDAQGTTGVSRRINSNRSTSSAG